MSWHLNQEIRDFNPPSSPENYPKTTYTQNTIIIIIIIIIITKQNKNKH